MLFLLEKLCPVDDSEWVDVKNSGKLMITRDWKDSGKLMITGDGKTLTWVKNTLPAYSLKLVEND